METEERGARSEERGAWGEVSVLTCIERSVVIEVVALEVGRDGLVEVLVGSVGLDLDLTAVLDRGRGAAPGPAGTVSRGRVPLAGPAVRAVPAASRYPAPASLTAYLKGR